MMKQMNFINIVTLTKEEYDKILQKTRNVIYEYFPSFDDEDFFFNIIYRKNIYRK